MKKRIVVCGSNGQLGQCLRDVSVLIPHEWLFTDIEELDITRADDVKAYLQQHKPAVVINCSAYTAVDNAENEPEAAYAVNALAVANLAGACKEYGSDFIHISTDYVFDGSNNTPYTETDSVNPLNVYGASKLKGEQLAMEALPETLVIRTSWLYSEYGKNFLKTMLKLGVEKSELRVIYDQTGTPTYAGDLAHTIIAIASKIIAGESFARGIYHYSNEGVCSWYDFASMIMKTKHIKCKITPILSSEFKTAVKRPAYSVLSKDKIKTTLNMSIPFWVDSMEMCLSKLP